ncbi:MAG TPA: AAA family ATPase, partial [Micromonosporaceae bacterium]|nr:AAA family ATPase [Micromonosporaceae bacterium]
MAYAVVGRSEELGVLGGFLADTRADPCALLIEGEPGIGKTTLLYELVALARSRGIPVLTCRPTRSEMDLSYVGLMELLAGIDEEVVEALPAPQARVLRMILRKEEPEGQFDRLSLCVAVVAAVRALATTRPVLVAVDDAQWLDRPSSMALAFVLRRLAGTATRVAVARRSGEPVEWIAELSRLSPEGRFDVLDLAPIGPSELSRILRRVLGWAPAWPRLMRIAELSGGNPLYALELARAFGGVRSGEELDGPLPDGVVELSRSRIARLPRDVRDLVETASVPRIPTLDMLRRLDPGAPDPHRTLAAAERGGIVTLDGDRVRFTHPILAASAYGSLPAARRRELHRAVAALSDDLEERARHLARAAVGPDPDVALALAGAAEQAWRRGAPDAAADLLRLACLRTPPEDTGALAFRRVAYGRLLHSAGDTPGAIAELDAVAGSLPPGPARARAHFHLMYVTRLAGSLGRAVEHGLSAAADAVDDPSFQAEVYELLSRISDNDIARKLDIARKGNEAAGHVDDPDPYVLFHARAALVEAEFYAGLGIHLERLDGLDPGAGSRFPPVRSAVGAEDLIGRLLTYAGRVDEGLAMLR